MITARLEKEKLSDLTDQLLTARKSNLKKVLDIEHRLETVSVIDGLEFINDSKSTSISATYYSLQCMDKPVVWLLSCLQGSMELSVLKSLVQEKVSSIFFIGAPEDPLVEEFINDVELIQQCENIDELLREAVVYADKDDIILFSPAAPTCDDFKDFKDRGEKFRKAVKQLN